MPDFVVKVIQSRTWLDYTVAVGTLASACVAFVAAVIAARSWRGARQEHAQSIVERLTSADVSRARNTVGMYARGREVPGPGEERDELREAAFVMMWALERATLHRSQAKESIIVNAESQVIYEHIEAMVGDLNDMFNEYDSRSDFKETASRVNRSLDALPPLKVKPASKPIRKAKSDVVIKDPPKNRLQFALSSEEKDRADEEKGASKQSQRWYQAARWLFPIVVASSSSIAAQPVEQDLWPPSPPMVVYGLIVLILWAIMLVILSRNSSETDENKLGFIALLMLFVAFMPLPALWALDQFDEPAVTLNITQLFFGILIGATVAWIGHFLPKLRTAEDYNSSTSSGSLSEFMVFWSSKKWS